MRYLLDSSYSFSKTAFEDRNAMRSRTTRGLRSINCDLEYEYENEYENDATPPTRHFLRGSRPGDRIFRGLKKLLDARRSESADSIRIQAPLNNSYSYSYSYSFSFSFSFSKKQRSKSELPCDREQLAAVDRSAAIWSTSTKMTLRLPLTPWRSRQRRPEDIA